MALRRTKDVARTPDVIVMGQLCLPQVITHNKPAMCVQYVSIISVIFE